MGYIANLVALQYMGPVYRLGRYDTVILHLRSGIINDVNKTALTSYSSATTLKIEIKKNQTKCSQSSLSKGEEVSGPMKSTTALKVLGYCAGMQQMPKIATSRSETGNK